MTAKRLGLMRELVPNATIIAILVNPKGSDTPHELREVQAAARSVSQKLIILNASTPNQIDKAFTTLSQQAVDALVVGSDPMFTSEQKKIFALAASHRIPTIYGSPETTPRGALASYGPSLLEAYQLAGNYTGKLLKGAKPADLPVLRPTHLRLMINLKVAKSLGLEVPPSILLRADQVIE